MATPTKNAEGKLAQTAPTRACYFTFLTKNL